MKKFLASLSCLFAAAMFSGCAGSFPEINMAPPLPAGSGNTTTNLSELFSEPVVTANSANRVPESTDEIYFEGTHYLDVEDDNVYRFEPKKFGEEPTNKELFASLMLDNNLVMFSKQDKRHFCSITKEQARSINQLVRGVKNFHGDPVHLAEAAPRVLLYEPEFGEFGSEVRVQNDFPVCTEKEAQKTKTAIESGRVNRFIKYMIKNDSLKQE